MKFLMPCSSGRAVSSGNGLTEYSIIAASVVLVAIVGVKVAGGNLNDIFSVLRGDMDDKVQMASQVRTQQTQAAQAAATTQPVASVSTPPKQVIAAPPAGGAYDSSLSAVKPYNPVQVAGANGIDYVDQQADIIKKLAEIAHSSPNRDITFALMLDDLAAEGHYVAADERASLTVFAKYGSTFDFSIQDRYAFTLNRAITYLNQHPSLLSEADTQTLHTASSNIDKQMLDFLNGSNPSAINYESINQKFTDAGGGNGATYVDHQATTICAQGGFKCN
jgi:hypothetical protein